VTAVAGAVAVVTGGASGIGRGIVEELLEAGAHPVIADLDAEALAAVSAELGVPGFVVDVADPRSVSDLAAAVIVQHGRVDIVVNNAGVGPQAPISELTVDDWTWLLGVNLFGVIHGVRAFLPLLKSNPEGGHVVNTASMAAFAPPAGLGAYAVAKAGVVALTEVLDAELQAEGSAVRATVLVPGSVRTNIGTGSLRHRPEGKTAFRAFDPESALTDLRWLEPRDVGRIVVAAIEADELYAITHPEQWPRVTARTERIGAAFERAAARSADEGDG
jgi:NAD(P)-dependent dehydrogenase (short-subunit alcohol dehydrogenase family)